MGRYRGVPQVAPHRSLKRARMARLEAQMREYHLNHGTGCKTRATAIRKRLAESIRNLEGM